MSETPPNPTPSVDAAAELAPTPTGRRLRLALVLLGLGVLLWLSLGTVGASLTKAYSVDEYQYAHGAWQIARGEVIYRDFFEHHFPFIHQILALAWLAMDDSPHNILVLRLVMLPFLALTLLAAAAINRRWGPGTALLTAILILACPVVVTTGTELRPDALALAFFFGAIAVLAVGGTGKAAERGPRWVAGALSGALLTLALWSTLKVAYYGIAFPAAFVADGLLWLGVLGESNGGGAPAGDEEGGTGSRGYLLGHPLAFAAGSLAVILLVALYLLLTGSADDWFHWCLQWSFVHQEHYPSVSWIQNFLQLYLRDHLWLYPLAALGLWQTGRRLTGELRERGDLRRAGPELLLLGTFVAAFASFVWQTAPYLYSALPFAVISALFAARGLAWACRALIRRARPGAPLRRAMPAVFGLGLLVLLLAGELSHIRTLLARLEALSNQPQHALWQRLEGMIEPDDPVYDIAARHVSHPSVHFFYFTDAVVRDLLGERLAREVPPAILEQGVTVYLHDDRFPSLPAALRGFLLRYFQPLDQELWIWGQRYRTDADGKVEGEFLAVRAGEYYVTPGAALQAGELVVGGETVPASGVIELTAGPHELRFQGPPGAGRELYVLWLPKDGERRHPIPERPVITGSAG